METKWVPVVDSDAIPLREGKKVIYQHYEIALFNLGEEYLAVDNRCPHKSGPLADGIVSGKSVFCPLHNWKIDLATGCALSGGAGQVKKYPVQILGKKVCIAFEAGELCETTSSVAVDAREMD